MLQIHLLGEFHVIEGESPVTGLSQPRLQALLTRLLLHRRVPQNRKHLAFLLWPDSTEKQAQTNLRKALIHLRRAAPAVDLALYIDHHHVQWRPVEPVLVDLVEFEEGIERAARAEKAGQVAAARQLLGAAVDSYAGALLPSCYDDWLITERERLQQMCIRALQQLMLWHENEHNLTAAVGYGQQLLRLDPLHETTHLHLMRLFALQDDRVNALRLYQNYAQLLEREVGVAPSQELQLVYQRLLNPQPHSHPTTARTSSPLTLIGRRQEWQTIQQHWQAAMVGQARMLCLSGEAGIGKTHLAEVFCRRLAQQGYTVLQTRCFAGEGVLAYAPLVEWLRSQPLRAVRNQLSTIWLSELARLLPEILIEQPTIPRPTPMSESWQRQHLFEALAQTLLATPQPLLLMIDDLQWCNNETLEWLRYLLHFADKKRLLLLCTVRIEEIDEAHPLQSLQHHLRRTEQWHELELGPLDANESAQLASQVAQRTLDTATQTKLYQTTEGNPLFVVETVRSAEGKTDEIGWSLSPKVQAVIQQRLLQLSPQARSLAALAAVIGRSFSISVLADASKFETEELAQALDELWQRRLVREQNATLYDFSHDRIREVAYAQISPARRRLMHSQVAQALERVFAESLDDWAGQMAVHYEAAGDVEQALRYYRKAGSVARQLCAYRDVSNHLTKTLSLLDTVQTTPEILVQKVDALLQLAEMHTIVNGYFAPEVQEVFAQALTLSRNSGQIEQSVLALCGLWNWWAQCCQWQKAVQIEEELLTLTKALGNPRYLRVANWCWGVGLFHRGNFRNSCAAISHALDLYPQSPPDTFSTNADILHRLALTQSILGYPQQARLHIEEALMIARSPDRPFQIFMTLSVAFYVAVVQRRIHNAQLLLEEGSALINKYFFTDDTEIRYLFVGWLAIQNGEFVKAIELIEQGLAIWKSQNYFMFYSVVEAWLAEAHCRSGKTTEGLSVIDKALKRTEESGDLFWNAELLRLKGTLFLWQGNKSNKAEDCFQQAIRLARSQEAKLFELRTTVSLARLLQQQNRTAEAHHQLSTIYNWFSEGFDTPDLQDARQLLDTLQ